MIILHIVNDLIRGGTEGQCARVAMGLAGCGEDDVHRVAVFRRQGFFLERVEAVCGPVYEIKIRHLVRLGTIKAVFNLKKWILAEKFDVVHTWDAESAIFGGMAARWTGVPLITSRRDLGAIYPCWKMFMLRWADRWAAKVVVNARAIARDFTARRGRFALPEEKVCFIPNVIDLEEFDKDKEGGGENAEWRMENEECDVLKIVCVSRMDPEKDHGCLLKAFKKLVEREPAVSSQKSEGDINPGSKNSGFRSQPSGFSLFLVGDGMERKELEKLVCELKIDQNVHFLGERDDIPSILSQMDVGVLIPKSNEGLSNSILEYMAAGLPVVCSDCGGNAELIRDGENGFVVPISDEKAVFLALKGLESAEKRKIMGETGRKRVENEFSKDFVLGEFERLYRSVSTD